jgi:uncharacterized protein (DUF2132 family)
MTPSQPNNPLHGVTLEQMLREMVDAHGWDGLARDVPVNCFRVNPTLTSALKYLRKAPRARRQVEELYVDFLKRQQRDRARRGSTHLPGPRPKPKAPEA